MFAGFVARMEDTRLPKCAMFGQLMGECGQRGGASKFVDVVSSGRPQSFRFQRRPVDDCSPGRRGMAQDFRTRGGTFMAKWVAAEKARSGLRHAVVCPNVTGRTKERIAQSKRARAGSLILIVHTGKQQAARTCILRAFSFVNVILPYSGVTFLSLLSLQRKI